MDELDRGEAGDFNIGKFWKNKKGLIVPQNKEEDTNCFLYACGIGKFKPRIHKGRISLRWSYTKKLRFIPF